MKPGRDNEGRLWPCPEHFEQEPDQPAQLDAGGECRGDDDQRNDVGISVARAVKESACQATDLAAAGQAGRDDTDQHGSEDPAGAHQKSTGGICAGHRIERKQQDRQQRDQRLGQVDGLRVGRRWLFRSSWVWFNHINRRRPAPTAQEPEGREDHATAQEIQACASGRRPARSTMRSVPRAWRFRRRRD